MKPVIKWAGGKTQLLNHITEMMPNDYGTYFEPYFGGGALYFRIQPSKAVINDANIQLMNLYSCIKDHPMQLMDELDRMQNDYNSCIDMQAKRDYFLKIRASYNHVAQHEDNSYQTSAKLIFLNKADFNGLYRVNKAGDFNVAFGQKSTVTLYDPINMMNISHQLNNSDTSIQHGDYIDAVTSAKSGDFVFFDPPYYSTFTQYQTEGFTAEDQYRLASLYKQLSSQGVYCMLTNSDTEFIRELYKGYKVTSVSVKRNINCDAAKRSGREVIITNY